MTAEESHWETAGWERRHSDASELQGGHLDDKGPGRVLTDGRDMAGVVDKWQNGSGDAQGIRRQLGKVKLFVMLLR